MIYKEGQKIKFKIKKHIELSEDEKYYVLEDENGIKQLMKSKFYENYNLKIGQYINCRIDHINCSGKIFLEPEHPYYEEGKQFKFIINNIKKTTNRLNEDVLLYTFLDKIGNKASSIVSLNKNKYCIGNKVLCKVERIKKGRLHLSFAEETSFNKYKRGKYYMFKIEDIKVLKDGFKYYILSDNFNNKYILKHDLYELHNLKIGQTIECTIIKYSSKGYYILEPRHPFYKIGKEYEFSFVSQEKDAEGEHTGNFDITVKDSFNEDVKFISEKSLLQNGKYPNKIKCKVMDVKKGKPIL